MQQNRIPLDHRALLVELARQDLNQRQLAERLGIRPSTFSSWVRGVNPWPTDLRERVEDALAVPRDTLKVLPSTTDKAEQ